jgi:spartin
MGHHDPRLLYSIKGIKAYHLQHGEETELTPSGPQTLSLLMVPTNSPFADMGTTEEDFYLHLNLPPELDLPLPATTQIYHQPPRSYLIPRWDLGPDSGAFTRIEFPGVGPGPDRVSQEDVDTFETILAQCTAFLERAKAPTISEKGGKMSKAYNPAEFGPGEAYVPGTGSGHHGQIVLVDEENGSVIGELAEGNALFEDADLRPGEKSMCLDSSRVRRGSNHTDMIPDPVEITISADGKRIEVHPISDEYLQLSRHPAYQSSSIVQNAAAASRLIVTGTGYIGNLMTSGAETFTQKTKPTPKPLTFTPTTHDRVRKINNVTKGAAELSSKTVGQATKYAQNIGATISRRSEKQGKEKAADYKPGLLNKSMIAFSTIADGIATSGKHLLTTSGAAATTVVGHRFGPEAGKVAAELTTGVKNVGLVYIDVTGVSRRALIKSTVSHPPYFKSLMNRDVLTSLPGQRHGCRSRQGQGRPGC